MARKWKTLMKAIEECGELIQECVKLDSYPDGKHPRRKRSVVLSLEEEIADVLAVLEYTIIKEKLNAGKIKRRKAYKFRKWEKRWGATKPPKKITKKQAKKRTSKKRAAGQLPSVDVSSIDQTS